MKYQLQRSSHLLCMAVFMMHISRIEVHALTNLIIDTDMSGDVDDGMYMLSA